MVTIIDTQVTSKYVAFKYWRNAKLRIRFFTEARSRTSDRGSLARCVHMKFRTEGRIADRRSLLREERVTNGSSSVWHR